MPRILVIDDDQDILKVLKANFEVIGFEVVTASHCAEADNILKDFLPDLIVLDLMLPDCDGVEYCRILRERGLFIPIIMLTARDSVSDRVLGLESGADDYVVKPFETIELIARIKACLRRGAIECAECIEAGDIYVNMAKREARVKGKKVSLTPKEFELLCLFIKNRDKVLSREFIRKALWKDTRKLYSWSRVIDVHVQHLRKKIEDDPSAPQYILTVPGVGYRFVTTSS